MLPLHSKGSDEYQTAWKAYLGDEFQVRLRGMQPTFSASLGREIAFIDPDHPPELPPATTPRDLACWTIASRVLLNLDETLNKN